MKTDNLIHFAIAVHLFFVTVWRVYDALPDGTAIRLTMGQSFALAVLTYKTRKVLHA